MKNKKADWIRERWNVINKVAFFVAIFLLSTSLASAALTDSLSAYWTMDSVADSTGRHNLTNNAPTTTTGKLGTAYYYDGNDDSEVKNSTYFDFDNASFSVNMWVLINNTYPVQTYIVHQRINSGGFNQWGIMTKADGNVTFYTYNTAASSVNTSSITYGTDHMVTGVRSGTNHSIYIDGVLVQSSVGTARNVTAKNATSYSSAYIGSISPSGTAPYFNGSVDEVGVWKNKALTQSEITSLYNSGAGLTYPFTIESSPVYYYVDSVSGLDTNTGLTEAQAIKTLDHLDSIITQNSTVYLKRGQEYRVTADSNGVIYLNGGTEGGSSTKPLIIDAYGSGAKPIIKAAALLNNTGNWTYVGSGVWKTTQLTSLNIANVWYYNTTTTLYDAFIRNTSYATMASSSNYAWYWNSTGDDVLFIYTGSATNPQTLLGGLEIAIGLVNNYVFKFQNTNYIVVANLTFMFAPWNTIQIHTSNNVHVRNVSHYYTGGVYYSGTTQGGDPLEVWSNSSNILVEYNDCYYAYDACYAPQAGSTVTYSGFSNNQTYRYNVASNGIGFESFYSAAASYSRMSNLSVYHNTFVDMALPYNAHGVCERLGLFYNLSGYNFTDNICYGAKEYVLKNDDWRGTWSSINHDYNYYKKDIPEEDYTGYYHYTPYLTYWGNTSGSHYYTTDTLAQWLGYTTGTKMGTQDTHSVDGTLTFSNYNTRDFRPLAGSSVCGAASDGTDIGAFACVAETDNFTVYINSSKNATIWGTDTIKAVDFYFVDAYDRTANCNLNINGTYNTGSTGLSSNVWYTYNATLIIANGYYQINVNCTNTVSQDDVSDNITIQVQSPLVNITNLRQISQDLTWIYVTWTNPESTDWRYNLVMRNGVNVANITENYYNYTGLNATTSYNLTIIALDYLGNQYPINITGTTRTFPQVTKILTIYAGAPKYCTAEMLGGSNMTDGNFATSGFLSVSDGTHGYCQLNYYPPNPYWNNQSQIYWLDSKTPTGAIYLNTTYFGNKSWIQAYNDMYYDASWYHVIMKLNYNGTNVTVSDARPLVAAIPYFYEAAVNLTYVSNAELAILHIYDTNGDEVTGTFTITNELLGNTTTGTLPLYLPTITGVQQVRIERAGYLNLSYNYTSTGNVTTSVSGLYNTQVTWLRNTDNTSITGAITCYEDINHENLLNTTLYNQYTLASGTNTLYCNDTYHSETETINKENQVPLTTTLYWEWSGATITYKDSTTDSTINNVNMELYNFEQGYYSNYATTTGTMTVYYPYPGTYRLRYNSTGYSMRQYYLIVSDSTIPAITLYLQNTTGSINYTVTVVDELANPQPGLQVRLLRFDTDTNTFVLDEIGTTNNDGITILTVVPNTVYYKFMVQNGENLLVTTSPEVLTGTTKTISVSLSTNYGAEAEEYTGITSSITFNTATNNFGLDWSDASGYTEGILLVVYEAANTTYTLVNTSTSISASGTILLGVPVVNGTTYAAYAYYLSGGEYKYLTGTTYTYPSAADYVWGKVGLLVQILLTLGVSSLVFISPVIAMILSPLTIVLGSYLGWISLSTPLIAGYLLVMGVLMAVVLGVKR